MIPRRFPLALLPFLVWFCQVSRAQQTPELIRVTATHVNVDVRVLNGKTGQPVPGLTREDFEVSEDGVSQEITHFSRDQLPVSVVLLLDVSGSMQQTIDELRIDALQTLQRLKPEDEVALIAYGGLAQLVQDFTTDRQAVVDRIGGVNDYYLGPRNTVLSEAVFQAAVHMAHAANPAARRVMVVITDDVSTDNYLAHTKQEALGQLVESTASLYGLTITTYGKLLHDQVVRRAQDEQATMPEAPGPSGQVRPSHVSPLLPLYVELKDFADPTGGAVFPTKYGAVAAKLGEILDDIRACYSIGYTPSDPTRNGRFRQIRVRLKRKIIDEPTGKEIKLVVIARRGYYAGEPQLPQDSKSARVSPPVSASNPELQMARALYFAKDRNDFRSSISSSVSLDAQGQGLVRIKLSIDPTGIHPEMVNRRYTVNLKLLAAVLNESGMMLANYGDSHQFRFDDAEYRNFVHSGTSVSLNFTLRPGRYEVKAVLFDPDSRQMSTCHTSVDITPP